MDLQDGSTHTHTLILYFEPHPLVPHSSLCFCLGWGSQMDSQAFWGTDVDSLSGCDFDPLNTRCQGSSQRQRKSWLVLFYSSGCLLLFFSLSVSSFFPEQADPKQWHIHQRVWWKHGRLLWKGIKRDHWTEVILFHVVTNVREECVLRKRQWEGRQNLGKKEAKCVISQLNRPFCKDADSQLHSYDCCLFQTYGSIKRWTQSITYKCNTFKLKAMSYLAPCFLIYK